MTSTEPSGTRGAWDTCHWLSVPTLTGDEDGQRITACIEQLDGVHTIDVDLTRRRLCIAYDQTRLDFGAIRGRLEEIGFPPAKDWWSRKKAIWFQYLDRNARINADLPASPCCSDPIDKEVNKKRSRGKGI